MINHERVARIAAENLENRMNVVLREKGHPSALISHLFRFISCIYQQLPPELITWRFRISCPLYELDVSEKEILHIDECRRWLNQECSIVMIDESRCILEDFELMIGGQSVVSYAYFAPRNELIHVDGVQISLPIYSDTACCSIFAVPVYRELDEALSNYYCAFAEYTQCGILNNIWLDSQKKKLCKKPEHLMRDSLWQYLRTIFRAHSIKREQNVDDTHPVDIKVTWPTSSNVALIEVKWIGDSGSTHYRDSRANDGAEQLVNYLQSSSIEEPDKNFLGYLTVFDARRRESLKDYYHNIAINYKSEYEDCSKLKCVRFYLREAN